MDEHKRLVYAEEVKEIFDYEVVQGATDLFDAFDSAIENATTVDAVEVVHGHWVSDKADILFHCSVCETQVSTDWDYDDLSWNYCPNCGAKMDGDVNDC